MASHPKTSTARRASPRAGAPAVFAAVFALAGVGAGCDSASEGCVGPEILPHLSPLNLGSLHPLPAGATPEPGSAAEVPLEVTLFLQSTCSTPLEITKVCVVGDAHNGDAGDTAFTIEGPVPATVKGGDAAAVRLTYDNGHVNRDLDGDGVRDPDNVAIVIESNAVNFPTLIVPVCAAIIPAADDATAFVCASPVTVAPGTSDPTLCP
ncbi:MAG: hypothetical protein CVU56_20900 [Deltaproteobacteria bacterium HGW-Deltaproteobacteria-14]|nr:MAG: hypothetical protein CVU56_20900 [Deltaproteobacteria bacterium HGW-Deltaproteobacteria-14]